MTHHDCTKDEEHPAQTPRRVLTVDLEWGQW